MTISTVFLRIVIVLGILQSLVFAQPTQFLPRGPGGGGALFLPSFNPAQPGEIALACDMSESFHTTDFGKSWSQTPFRQLQTANNRGHIQFTKNPLVQYTIDATSLGGSDTFRPTKSTDGGKTWQVLSTDPTSAGAFYLYASFTNPNAVVVADYNNVYCSLDGGKTWKTIYTTKNAAGIHVAGVLFFEPEIFVGLSTGIVYSADAGTSFVYRNDISGIDTTKQAIFSLSGAQTIGIRTTTTLYAAVHAVGDVYGGVTALDRPAFQGIYVTSWDTKKWVKKINGIADADQPYFVSCAATNEPVCYAAGGSSNAVPTIYKTTDGGDNWTETFKATNNQNITTGWSGYNGDRQWSYGEVALGFAVNRADPNQLVFTDFGYAHLSIDGGANWKQMYVDPSSQNPAAVATPKGKSYLSVGLENTTCWQIVWLDSLNLFGCYSDIQGTRSTDGGKSWGFNYTGHSDNSMYFVVKHPQTGVVYGATSTVHDMYQSTYLQDSRIDNGKGKVLYSSNNGAAWQILHDFAHPVIWLALDPTNPKRMFASVIHSSLGGVYVCNDITAGAASAWTKLAAPPRTEGHPFNLRVLNDGTLVATYSGRRDASGKFTASSGVYVWNGSAWADRSDTGMQYWTKDIVIDPNDASQNTWYCAVFSGWGGAPNGKGGLYRTTNRGQAWTKINNQDRVTSIAFDPTNTKQAYMTTETEGLWYYDNVTQLNPTATQVAAYPFRQPERVFFNPYKPDEMWVSSFGNGMKVSGVKVPGKIEIPNLVAPDSASQPLSRRITFKWQTSASVKRCRFEISRDPAFASLYFSNDSATTSTALSFKTNESGRYFWRVKAFSSTDSSDWSYVWPVFVTHTIDASPLVNPACGATKVALPASLSWTNIGDADSYRVVVAKDPLLKTIVFDTTLPAIHVSASFWNASFNTIYYWCVYDGNVDTPGEASDTCSFTTRDDPSNVEDEIAQMRLRPQPARENCRLTLPQPTSSPCKLRLHDVMGCNVLSQNVEFGTEAIELDVHSFARGVYVLTLVTDDGKLLLDAPMVVGD